jgi:hypothetical protein
MTWLTVMALGSEASLLAAAFYQGNAAVSQSTFYCLWGQIKHIVGSIYFIYKI